MQLPFLCEKSRAIALALPGLTAGSQAVRRNSAKFNFFLNYVLDEIVKFLLCLTKVRCYYRHTNTF